MYAGIVSGVTILMLYLLFFQVAKVRNIITSLRTR